MAPALALIVALVLALSFATPIAVLAAPSTMTVDSDDSGATVITKVYNKAGGGNSVVDLSASPLTPIRAWEPDPYPTTYNAEPPEATDSTWDNAASWDFETNAPNADWIWETGLSDDPASYDTSDPLYDANAARNGRVVLFETTFTILGNPTSGEIHIACDNAYEFWVNSGTHIRSATAVGGAGWENSDLKQANVTTSGWTTVVSHDISGDLVIGTNTLYVLAGNEFFDDPPDDVDTGPGTSNNNPGAVIFLIDIEYETNLDVSVDIKPTSCPNPLNVKGKGVLPVAILGTADFDVTTVDVSTVTLAGVGPPLRSSLEDVATPYDGTPGDGYCEDCTTAGPDGFMDLTLKFDKQAVVAALGTVEDGACLVLTLAGNLLEDYGGTPISGQDVVRIIKKGRR